MEKIVYSELNARQQESYNFQKVAGVLADYGSNCIRLSDDWQGADFIAHHINGNDFLKVQLKGKLTINKKYIGKKIHIAFRDSNITYIYPHDELMNILLEITNIKNTSSWKDRGAYHFVYINKRLQPIMDKYKRL